MSKNKVWAAPDGLDKPEWSDFDDIKDTGKRIDKLQEAEKAYERRIKDWVKENSETPDHELVNVEVRVHEADGYARYLVLNIKPLELIHIDTGDAWHADDIWLKGLDLDDVKMFAKRAKNPLFGNRVA